MCLLPRSCWQSCPICCSEDPQIESSGFGEISAHQSHSLTPIKREKNNEDQKRILNSYMPCSGMGLTFASTTKGPVGSRTVWSQCRCDSRSWNHLCQPSPELLR